jgi:hypothetical protein
MSRIIISIKFMIDDVVLMINVTPGILCGGVIVPMFISLFQVKVIYLFCAL